jgi:hypothetical protein
MIGPLEALEPSRRLGGTVPSQVIEVDDPAARSPGGSAVAGQEYERVIYTRDTWMHRMDTARAVGVDVALTPEHDGRIVADVVADWARRHGRPFELELRARREAAIAPGSAASA